MILRKRISFPLDGHKFVNGHEFNYKLSHGGVNDTTVKFAYKYDKIIVFFKTKKTGRYFNRFFNDLIFYGEVEQTKDHKKWIRVVKKPTNMNTLF